MKHYTIPSYLDPLKTERGYIHYQSKTDKRCNCIVATLIAFGAGVAVGALITDFPAFLTLFGV